MSRIVIILTLVISSFAIQAQPPNNPSGDPDVPITGIEILLSAGALLGLKKLMGKSKQK
ncbi:MAG: hypothetical protein KDC93_15270 [Cyclobacteriaceae bacterium]|nr:hypothetical protein [Cyclobacteriaceae bacterium]